MGTPKAVNQKAEKVLHILTDGLKEPGDHKTFDKHKYTKKWDGGIMAVHVEHIGFFGYFPLYSIAHYYKQNGDMMQDPEMLFFEKEGRFYPCMFQQADPGIYQESIYRKEGVLKFNPRMQSDHVSFANMWMKNIKEQQAL